MTALKCNRDFNNILNKKELIIMFRKLKSISQVYGNYSNDIVNIVLDETLFPNWYLGQFVLLPQIKQNLKTSIFR